MRRSALCLCEKRVRPLCGMVGYPGKSAGCGLGCRGKLRRENFKYPGENHTYGKWGKGNEHLYPKEANRNQSDTLAAFHRGYSIHRGTLCRSVRRGAGKRGLLRRREPERVRRFLCGPRWGDLPGSGLLPGV